MADDMSRAVTPLRERKRDAAREVILEAAAGVVLSEGVQGFSIQNVADRAGVSHRTVYRYFQTRQELLDSLDAWVDEWRVQNGVVTPGRIEETPAFAATLFGQFEAQAPFFLAASMLELGTGAQSARRARTTEQVRRVFGAAFPYLSADERRRSYAVLRHLISLHTWQILRTQHGLRGEDSGPVVARVVELALADLARRDREARSPSQGAPGDGT